MQLGIRGVQAIPLIDGGGRPLGVLSAYFRAPVLPSASDMKACPSPSAR